MIINIFVGIEGTHTLIDSMIGGTSVALPNNNNKVHPQLALDNILLVTGPTIKYPFDALALATSSLDTVLLTSFITDDTKTVCNLGFFGFANTAAIVIDKAPVGSRIWFFRPTDSALTAECLIEMSKNFSRANNVRIIGEYGNSITTTEQAMSYLDDRMSLLTEQLKSMTNLYSVHDWQPFDADLFNGRDAPLTSSIEAMCWEITS